MKDKKMIFRISFLVILALLVIGVTYAWFVWRAPEDKSVSVSIGQITVNYDDGPDITNNNLIPVSTKEKGIVKDIIVSSSSPTTLYLNLYLNVKSISDYLKEDSFKWAIYNGDSVITEGNFSSVINGNDITLLDGVAISSTPTTYTLYIWIDGNMSNPNDMFNQSFDYYLHADASNEGEGSSSSSRTSSEMLEYLGLSANEGTPDFSQTATTDEGIYSAQDDYGTSYYFRGASTNNYVKFANKYWRIIRINGDGTIRLIYDGTSAHANGESSTDRQISTSAFNSSYNDNAYVGYMYGQTGASSYSATHANTNSSTIKTTVDNWYKTNIVDAGYSDKVADVIYCNDRQIDNLSGYGTALGYGRNQTAYMARYRLYTNKSPVLTCTNKNDRFTVDDTTNGNGALTYPVGLITADEMSMGGAVYASSNSSYYLYTGNDYWTMSPCFFRSGNAHEFYVDSSGNINYSSVYYSNGVRPVLSLKSDISVTGSGTQSDPWVVQ